MLYGMELDSEINQIKTEPPAANSKHADGKLISAGPNPFLLVHVLSLNLSGPYYLTHMVVITLL